MDAGSCFVEAGEGGLFGGGFWLRGADDVGFHHDGGIPREVSVVRNEGVFAGGRVEAKDWYG